LLAGIFNSKIGICNQGMDLTTIGIIYVIRSTFNISKNRKYARKTEAKLAFNPRLFIENSHRNTPPKEFM